MLDWFSKEARDLPWRHHYVPYEVWISEIMLQQTQVKTVLPYFERWLKVFPDVKALARAPIEKVLKHWEGLGYYSRARNLHKAAQMIVRDHDGHFPSDFEAILKLPGIGRYTAGAISSIAFNQNRPIVDGNVIRVLSRVMNFTKDTSDPKNLGFFWKQMEDLIPKGKARYFNQSVMELGALICSPKSPDCPHCPLKKICKSNAIGNQDLLPLRGKKVKLESIQVALAVIFKDGKVFIQQRPLKGLMGGLWEFPGGKVKPKERIENALKREIKEELSISIKNIKPFMRIDHGYTKFKVDLRCFLADYNSGKLKLNVAQKGKWVSISKLREHAFPAANVKLIAALQKKRF